MDEPVRATDFDEFVDARYHRLVRMAYLLTRDNGTAEDLVQTALVKSWPKCGASSRIPRPTSGA